MTARVISISGPPGAGKSMLACAVAKRLDWALVCFDDFELMTRRSPTEIHDWLERGADYAEMEAPGYADAIARAMDAGAVVLDTPLGRADATVGHLVDFSVWLDCPADIALARKLRQFAGGVPTGQERGFLDWLDAYLRAHELIVRRAVDVQVSRVRPVADLVLDSTQERRDLVARVVASATP